MSIRSAAAVRGAWLAGALVLWAAAPAAGEPEPPVNITAAKMEYFSDRDLVVFEGDAVAVREDVTLSADRMEVTLGEGAEEGQSGSVRRIVAVGNVQFRQAAAEGGKERLASGERGEYDGERKVVTLSGTPKVWEGQNVVTGEVMRFFIDEHRFSVEGGAGLTIFPEKDEQGGE